MTPLTTRIAPTPGGGFVTGGEDGTVALFRGDGTPVLRYAGPHAAIRDLTASPAGELLAAAAQDGSVFAWQLARSEPLVQLSHERPVRQCAVAGRDAYLTLDTTRVLRLWRGSAEVLVLDRATDAFGVSGGTIVVRDGFRLRARRAAAGDWEPLPKPLEPTYLARLDGVLALSRNGAWLLVYWDEGAVFDTRTGRAAYTFRRRLDPAFARMSDDGGRCAIASADGELAVFRGGREVLTRRFEHGLADAELSADGRILAIATARGEAQLLDMDGGSAVNPS